MATSGTTTFNLDLASLVEEAFERCGAEMRSGYDLRTARRSLNLMFADWANRGVNMWTIDQGSVPLVAGVAVYSLPTDTVDVLDTVLRYGTGVAQRDRVITRVSLFNYTTIPMKNASGVPSQIVFTRAASPVFTVWPVPADGTYTLVYWRLRRLQDAGGGINNQDVPFRFLPVLAAGLAYYLAIKIPQALERVPLLKAQYDEAWQFASEEDRDRAPVRFVPRKSHV